MNFHETWYMCTCIDIFEIWFEITNGQVYMSFISECPSLNLDMSTISI